MHSAFFTVIDDYGNKIIMSPRLYDQHFVSSNTYGANDIDISAEVVDV